MQYGQIIFFLFVVLLLYYAGMIALDLYKAKMAQAAEQEGQKEENIYISDEAKNFQPIKITKDEPKKQDEQPDEQQTKGKQENDSESDSENSTGDEAVPSNEAQSDEESPNADRQEEKPFRRPGYREAIMTDGIEVESLMEQVNLLAEKGTSDLGALICTCENAQ